nr:hypothetical protein [Tanacetum cinerariifolium]
MRIDELHKFNDETLIDVRTTLDDLLKGIRMRYLPQTIWRKSDKDRAVAMIRAIDKRPKTRRIMRSLESFGVDDVEDFKEYTLRDYYCWLKTYCCWYKLKLLDDAAGSRLRLLEESVAADEKMKKLL